MSLLKSTNYKAMQAIEEGDDAVARFNQALKIEIGRAHV